MLLKIINNLSKQEFSFTVSDLSDYQLLYHFRISLPEGLSDGEYAYELYNNDTKIKHGLMQIGNYTPTKIAYSGNTSEYTQYNG